MTAVASTLGIWSNRRQSYGVEYGKPKDYGRNNHQNISGGGRGNFDGRRGGTGYEYGHTVQYRHSRLWSGLTGQVVQTGPEMQPSPLTGNVFSYGSLTTNAAGAELISASTGTTGAVTSTSCKSGDVIVAMAFNEAGTTIPSLPTATFSSVKKSTLNGQGWYASAYGNGRLVLAAFDAVAPKLAVSTDEGDTWVYYDAPTRATSRFALCYGGNWFTFHPGSTIYYSLDGVTWSSAEPPLGGDLFYGDGKFLLFVGTKTYTAPAPYGPWTTGTTYSGAWKQPVFGNGVWVMTPESATTNLLTSTDGLTWTLNTGVLPTARSWNGLLFGNGVFVLYVANFIAYSTNGTSWTEVAVSGIWQTGEYGGGYFYLVHGGANTVATSPDGVNWTSNTRATGPLNPWVARYAFGKLVTADYTDGVDVYVCHMPLADWVSLDASSGTAVGSRLAYRTVTEDGAFFAGSFANATSVAAAVYRKLDATTPTLTYSVTGGTGTTITLPAATTTGTDPVVSFAAHKSSDVLWPARKLTFGNMGSVDFWNGVAYASGVFYALTGGTPAASSVNGYTWTPRTLATSYAAITSSGSLFLVTSATNTTAAATSPDGVNWTSRPLPAAGYFYASAFGGGLFVVLATGTTTAYSSTNGVTWATNTLPTASPWQAVTYGTAFIAVCRGSTATAVSSNGTTWTAGGNMPSAVQWCGIAYGSGLYVAVAGYQPGSATSVYATTTDGTVWTQRTMPVSAVWSGIAFGNGVFLAVSDLGSYISSDGLTWSLLDTTSFASVASDGTRFVAIGKPGTSTDVCGVGYSLSGSVEPRASQVDAVDAIAIYDSAGPAV